MKLIELKTFEEENSEQSTTWVESVTHLVKISESMAQMLFSKGWAIYFRESDYDRLYYRSWWDYIPDETGYKRCHQFPENQNNYYVKESAIAKENLDLDDISKQDN